MKFSSGARRRLALSPSWFARAALVAIVGAALASGCTASHSKREPGGDGPSKSGPPIVVDVLAITDHVADQSLVLPGRVEARSEMTLTARVSGRLTRLPLREGAAFRAGETLAEFFAPEVASAVRAAQARLDAAASADVRARRQEARFDSLYARGVIALRDLEVTQNAARAAGAERSAASAELDRWKTGTRLSASFEGVVVRRWVDVGADVAAGQPLLDLRSRAHGEVAADLPESYLGAIEHATFELRVGEGAWHPARLVRVEGMIDASSRTRRAYFALRTDGAKEILEPGAFARVRIAGAGLRADRIETGYAAPETRSIVVPARALVRRGGLTGVFIVSEGRARLRWVRPGRVAGDSVEIAAGLLPGDQIVLAPSGLSDGQPVRPRS